MKVKKATAVYCAPPSGKYHKEKQIESSLSAATVPEGFDSASEDETDGTKCVNIYINEAQIFLVSYLKLSIFRSEAKNHDSGSKGDCGHW